jgi:hypothetical protein
MRKHLYVFLFALIAAAGTLMLQTNNANAETARCAAVKIFTCWSVSSSSKFFNASWFQAKENVSELLTSRDETNRLISGANAPQYIAHAPALPAIQGMVTSTPMDDGAIAHIVQYGETVAGIAEAYGISVGDLTGMNNLDPRNPIIYEKQVLIIRLAFTPTPYMTPTFTPRPPTRTPAPTRTPRPTSTPTQERTPEPTATATEEPLVRLPTLDDLGPARPVLAYTFIGISAIGLLVLFFTSFWPTRRG